MKDGQQRFPDWLPDSPPSIDEVYELLDRWENVDRINDINWEERDGQRVLEYMIVNTDEGRGFRLIWEQEESQWSVSERSSTY
jgi:hypothetical protein